MSACNCPREGCCEACSTLQRAVMQCIILQHNPVQTCENSESMDYGMLQRSVAAHCNTLQHTATHCNAYLSEFCKGSDNMDCKTVQHTAAHCMDWPNPQIGKGHYH